MPSVTEGLSQFTNPILSGYRDEITIVHHSCSTRLHSMRERAVRIAPPESPRFPPKTLSFPPPLSFRRRLLRAVVKHSRAPVMAFRAREIYKKIVRKVGADSVPAEVLESVRKSLPNNKLVMGRAKRGIYAGRHIQFGNKVSEDGGNKSRRTWKPNVQTKRLFSYIHDRHIRVKVTTHALRCIDKAGGIDEYLLKTPYHKMETETGLVWKAKVEKMYAQLGNMEVGFFSPEEEAKIEKGFEELQIAKREARRDARRALAKQRQVEEGRANSDETTEAKQIQEGMTDDVKKAEQDTPNLS